MANEGALITAGATLLASAAFLLAAIGTRTSRTGRKTISICAFFAISSAFLVLSGARQIFAYGAATNPSLSAVDRGLFYALLLPAGAAIVPLVHVATRMRWGQDQARHVARVFVVLVIGGLFSVYLGGIEGPTMSYWGSEWEMKSPIAKGFLIGVVTLPALISSTFIIVVGSKLEGRERRHAVTVGASFLVYYLVFTTDALGLPGAILVVERLITAAMAILAYLAYHQPVTPQVRLTREEVLKNEPRRGP